METYRPSAVVRTLATLLSALYVFGWVLCGVLVALFAGAELFVSPEQRQDFEISIPVALELPDLALQSAWNGRTGILGVDNVRASMKVPLALAPLSFRMVGYAVGAIGCGLVIAFLYHLRAIFRRARDGRPFDPANVSHLRWLGLLLIATQLLVGLVGRWQLATVAATIQTNPTPVGRADIVDGTTVVAVLVLFALAEIFKRGAALEDEQALVV
jgi:hypothetical protein